MTLSTDQVGATNLEQAGRTLLAESHPGDGEPGSGRQRKIELLARESLAIADEAQFEEAMAALDRSHPGHPLVRATRIRRLIRQKSIDRAMALLNETDFAGACDRPWLSEKLALLYEARDYEAAEILFAKLTQDFPTDFGIRAGYARVLLDSGNLVRACEVLAPVRELASEGSKERALADSSANLLALLTSLEGRALRVDEDSRILAMKHAILHFKRRKVKPADADGPGRLTLITGGLGPGGAERQLTRLAIELQRASDRREVAESRVLPSAVEVVVRSHSPEKQNDFYLDDLQSAGVELHQMNDFPSVAPRALGVDSPSLLQLLAHLPPVVNFGVKRLTQHCIEKSTETVSLWQDGACLLGGLAALIADVPQIQIVIRGLPPSVRRHMYRPEYEVLYRALAEVPGVTFVSNSNAAAKAYSDWLDVDLGRFDIVYNGVQPMSSAGSTACEELWREFDARTQDALHTVGGVFRFETDKQPLTWIRFAARYLKRHENARFIAVGGGRLLEHAIKLAEDYGIDDRILFVGRSVHVGFWMRKMDVLVLLSRFEGLPNVLIEAQFMGVQVVTTPAGGAPECLIDGVSGHVLDCTEKPDYRQMISRVHELATRGSNAELFGPGGKVRNFLERNFSIPRMIDAFVACTMRSRAAAMTASGGEDAWGEAA